MSARSSRKSESIVQFAQQSERLSLLSQSSEAQDGEKTAAVGARFITPKDPVIELANGDRLPAVPLAEAQKLNELKDKIEDEDCRKDTSAPANLRQAEEQVQEAAKLSHTQDPNPQNDQLSEAEGAPLRSAVPPSRTDPLFPPLPLYGPPTLARSLQCTVFQVTSFFLSLSFLAVIVVGSAFTSLPLMFRHIGARLICANPDSWRPFHWEEKRRRKARKESQRAWKHKKRQRNSIVKPDNKDDEENTANSEQFIPTEGGKDPLVCDASYYARRVGLDIEEYKVQTEDGFIINLWHVYNPSQYTPASAEERGYGKPEVFQNGEDGGGRNYASRNGGRRRYPVLMMHGLLQSAGAYCTNDDDSLAFFLAKSGYDVWLGNNRCGFKPEHKLLKYNDPRFWAWNIRQMGVMDLPALVSRVLKETGFPKLGLVCHSQGTTQTFVALAKEQRPDLGSKISVFCALAPAVYAGPLIGKMYFKFMRVISPGMFRIFFGIHAFIPFMMSMHSLLPGTLYGALGYRVFSFLFNWTDDRWERDLRDRMFQFAPVYVSAESMRWWLGRECFAKHKCILATKEEGRLEDAEDEEDEEIWNATGHEESNKKSGIEKALPNPSDSSPTSAEIPVQPDDRGRLAWYDDQAPPFALWIAGSDELVDGRRLLRRFERGREPHVRVVHAKVIEEYEHLDVLWAMDVIEKIGVELRDVLWRTAEGGKEGCIVPNGCEEV